MLTKIAVEYNQKVSTWVILVAMQACAKMQGEFIMDKWVNSVKGLSQRLSKDSRDSRIIKKEK